MATIKPRLALLILALQAFLSACNDGPPSAVTTGQLANATDTNSNEQSRWYTQAQVERGGNVFADNCAVCHGGQAQGLAENWRQRNADGSFPAPPLNGTAHAWHHPLVQLVQTIETGGQPYGGQMPPFEGVLSDDDKLAAIAFFQSFWSAEIYRDWLQMGGLQ